MSGWVRTFIAVVFSLVGLSFFATTGVMIWEFRSTDWLGVASFYSHLFLFFPTFGIVALLAFFTPACVFTDMYMRHIPWGMHRYSAGLAITLLLSMLGAGVMTAAGERSIFEVAPAQLLADRDDPARCKANPQCGRLPVLQAMENVRRVSQDRIGIADLARNCRPDALKDPLLNAAPAKRYCFVATPLPADLQAVRESDRLSDGQCCAAQQRFTEAVRELHDQPDGRSLTAVVHTWTLPFKIFFALILLIISILLAARRAQMERHYGPYLTRIERGVLVGAVAMVVYPIMSHAFLQSAALLYHGGGPTGGYRSTAPAFSFALGAWGLLILFFFYSRQNEKVQNLGRIGGMIGSAVAVLKYDQIIDVCVRLFGSGAGPISVTVLCLAALAAAWLVHTWKKRDLNLPRLGRRESAGQED